MTTRQPREGEIHGVHYYFVTEDEFVERIGADVGTGNLTGDGH